MTLTAGPVGTDQRFLGWSGDCSPQGANCNLTINGNRSVTATFGHSAASYPTVCIPPPPSDLNCGDIPYHNFTVLWDVPDPDPHHFDGDHDGIGCETQHPVRAKLPLRSVAVMQKGEGLTMHWGAWPSLPTTTQDLTARWKTGGQWNGPKLSDPEYRVRVTLESKDRDYVDRAFAHLVEQLSPDMIVRTE